MHDSYCHFEESAQYIRARIGTSNPEVLLVLGTGLNDIIELAESATVIPYEEIPHFKKCSAGSHKGNLIIGRVGTMDVMIMQGRFHLYEGYDPQEVTYPIRVAGLLGITTVILTNASGGINFDYRVGDIMLISDYIQFNMKNPLTGPNLEAFHGKRCPDMTHAYDEEYRKLMGEIAREHNDSTVREGVYFYASGPQLETPAEIRAMRLLGGDAVGMSTVPETLVATHMGMRILGIAIITNLAAGMSNEIDGKQIRLAAIATGKRLCTYLHEFIERI